MNQSVQIYSEYHVRMHYYHSCFMAFLLLIPMTYLNFPQFDSPFCLFTHNSLFFLLTSLNNLISHILAGTWSYKTGQRMNNQASSNVDPPILHFPLRTLLFFSHMILNLLERYLLRAPYVLNAAETALFFSKANGLLGTSKSVIVASIIS